MTFYCHSGSCLRAYLLRYFGENAPEHCDNCSVCSTQTEKGGRERRGPHHLPVPEGPALPLGAATVIDALRGSESACCATGWSVPTAMAACAVCPRAAARDLQPPYGRGLSGTGSGAVSHAFAGAPALEFLEYGGTVTLRVARGRHPAPTRARRHCPRIWRCSSA